MKPSNKRENSYRITIEDLHLEAGAESRTLHFEFQDREDIFDTVDKLNRGSGLDENTATKVAVALRLLGPVMMVNRKHPLFVDFMPHFKTFMHNLKATVKTQLGK